jgi:o-succinylbenzoate synthase
VEIQSVRLQRLKLKMKEPFETSFGREEDKDVIIVTVETQTGGVGYGECVAMAAPLYNEETNGTAWHMLQDFFIPAVAGMTFASAEDLGKVRECLHPFKRNNMAKAALEMAIWDAYANETKTPLVHLLGSVYEKLAGGEPGSELGGSRDSKGEPRGLREEIPVGISIGIQPTIVGLVEKVNGYIEQGFKRIKVKVRPGYDLDPLRAIRAAFPDIPLMADANSAYRLSDIEHLQRFDEFDLMMVEQPLAHDDIVDHARLQKVLSTPVCLDESIHGVEDVRKAVELGACRIINLKLGRVGGFGEALLIHEACQKAGLDLWCGGMLETGIGRLHNVAITALPGFTLAGDTAPSARYFEEDLIDPPVTFSHPGMLAVEPLTGVAERVKEERLQKWLVADSVQNISSTVLENM